MRPQTTSTTLLSRVGAGDEDAWAVFDARYGNLIVRYGCRLGLKHADSEDVRQVVMVKLSQALRSFHYRRERGRFRGYLGQVIRNEVARQLGRPDPSRSRVGAPGPSTLEATSAPAEAEWEREWVQHHLRMAMRRVRQVHDPRSVKVFERLLSGDSAAEVASSFGMSVDAVYKVKHRIRDRLRDIVAEQIRDEDESDGRTGPRTPSVG